MLISLTLPSSLLSLCCLVLISFNGAQAAKKKIPKCKICKDIVKNFNQGLKDTAKSNFGGGNTKWEEKSLGSYAHSETRLVEIVENLCKDSDKECHGVLEEHEEMLEHFWFKEFGKKNNLDLHQWLCIDEMKACCPNNTFGRLCRECPGGVKNVCMGNGKCQGEGTREGSGKCKCTAGYKGELCDECKDGYWEESKSETHATCKVCHISCKDTCSEGGPKGCDDCKEGWLDSEEVGCQDVNECSDDPCEEKQFCTNTQGSYSCFTCDLACASCNGSGAALCLECAEGYQRHVATNICADINECQDTSLCQNSPHEECLNLPGSHECVCTEGYTLDVDGNCEAIPPADNEAKDGGTDESDSDGDTETKEEL